MIRAFNWKNPGFTGLAKSGLVDALGMLPTNLYTTKGVPSNLIDSANATLEAELISAGIWNDILFLVVGIGGDSASFVKNLKNPTEFATYPVGTTFDFDGIKGYFNPEIANSTLNQYSKNIFIYKRLVDANWDMGVYDGANSFALNGNGTVFVNSGSTGGFTPLSGAGLYQLNVVNSSLYNFWHRDSKIGTGTPDGGNSALDIIFGGLNTPSGYDFDGATYTSVAGIINRGLTDIEAVALNTAIETYNTTLKRSYSSKRNKVRFYGDSITYGFMASTPSARWTSVLCKLMGWEEMNFGVSGETLVAKDEGSGYTSFMDHYLADIPVKSNDDDYIFISYGTNETIHSLRTVQEYKDSLTTVINYAISIGWSTSNIVIGLGYYVGSGLTADQETKHAAIIQGGLDVCNTLGVSRKLNLKPLMVANGGDLLGDGLHPNDNGYAYIALAWRDYLNSVGVYSIWS